MSALAKYVLRTGRKVYGSDKYKSDITVELEKAGATIYYKHSRRNVKKGSLVVYCSAISDDNPELIRAKKLNLVILKRSEFLNLILCRYKNRIAVCGSHGKTTATAMISEIFALAGLDPAVFLGGESNTFSNFRYGDGNYVITEACEYKKNFLDLDVTFTVVLNVDNDHMDCYGDMNEMKKSFNRFINGRVSVINNDDKESKDLYNTCALTYAIKSRAVFTAKNLRNNGKGYSFTVYKNGKKCRRINLLAIGKHNVYNTLASFATADWFGIPYKIIKTGLENFKGVKRRNEFLGFIGKTEVYADYAHHPTEIAATLDAFNINETETAVVFQPHTYSRTKFLMQEFKKSFNGTKRLIIYKTYAARERYDASCDAFALYKELTNGDMNNCTYANTERQLKEQIINVCGVVKRLVVLGAGDIYEKVKKLIDRSAENN